MFIPVEDLFVISETIHYFVFRLYAYAFVAFQHIYFFFGESQGTDWQKEGHNLFGGYHIIPCHLFGRVYKQKTNKTRPQGQSLISNVTNSVK